MKAVVMNRFVQLSAGSTTLLVVWSSSHADEPLPRGHYKCTGVEVVPIDRINVGGKISDQKSDKLTHWIRFDVHPKFEVVKGTEALPFKVLNPAGKLSLTLDKAIEFKGEKVPAETNLLKFKKFDGSFFNVHMPKLNPLAIHSASIKSGFKIPDDDYSVKFEWTTDDGEKFSAVVKVHIDVDLPK